MNQLRVENLTRGQTLVTGGRVADGYWSRLRGLIGHKPLGVGEGLLIVPCSSIHSHFMRFPIDAVFADKDQKVVAVDEEMVPWRFGRIRRGARFVVELPAGTARVTGTQVGDQLRVQGCEV